VSEVPLCSSHQIVNALQRAGFAPARTPSGDHQMFVRVNPDGTKNLCVVVIGQRQVARYTLRSLLAQAGMTVDEFRRHLR
jgi:predicted RNA binding protein YcfA (HicA-like mRNA interferase family)